MDTSNNMQKTPRFYELENTGYFDLKKKGASRESRVPTADKLVTHAPVADRLVVPIDRIFSPIRTHGRLLAKEGTF